MGLRERIDNPDRRQTDLTPIVERRAGVRVPEWRRRAIEQQERLGYIAVADLTERRAA
jgi:hypothetical protein